MVNLDMSLFDATIEIRKFYLQKIITNFVFINNSVK
jgi:hypothetical protein